MDRAHARWLRFRLAALFPAFAGALATTLTVGLQPGQPDSLRVASLSLALLLDFLLGWFLLQTLACARLQAARRFHDARVLRRLLLPSPVVALLSLLVLCAVGGLPFLVPEPPPEAPRPPVRSHAPPRAEPFARPEPLGAALAEPEVEAAPPAPAQETPPPSGLPAALRDAPPGDEDDDRAAFRFDLAPLRELPPLPVDLRLERLGLPDERDPSAGLPVVARIDALLLGGDGAERAPAMALLLDFPTGPGGSFRTTYLFALLSDGSREPLEGTPDLSYARATFEYVVRLAGFTRHAAVDLSVSAGLSLDVLDGDAAGVSGTPRLSPYVAVDLGLFQSGALGVLLHAGQSIPLNVTGATSSVTELSAMLRIDLTERISLHAGYRYLLVRMNDYDGPLDAQTASDAFETALSGPLVGLEIRF